MGSGMLVIGLIALAIGAVLLFFGRRAQSKTNLIKNVVTSTVKDLPSLLARRDGRGQGIDSLRFTLDE